MFQSIDDCLDFIRRETMSQQEEPSIPAEISLVVALDTNIYRGLRREERTPYQAGRYLRECEIERGHWPAALRTNLIELAGGLMKKDIPLGAPITEESLRVAMNGIYASSLKKLVGRCHDGERIRVLPDGMESLASFLFPNVSFGEDVALGRAAEIAYRLAIRPESLLCQEAVQFMREFYDWKQEIDAKVIAQRKAWIQQQNESAGIVNASDWQLGQAKPDDLVVSKAEPAWSELKFLATLRLVADLAIRYNQQIDIAQAEALANTLMKTHSTVIELKLSLRAKHFHHGGYNFGKEGCGGNQLLDEEIACLISHDAGFDGRPLLVVTNDEQFHITASAVGRGASLMRGPDYGNMIGHPLPK